MRILRLVPAVSTAIAGSMAFMGQVTPEQAVSNYAAWVKWLGGVPPGWMMHHAVDVWGTIIFLFLAVISLFWFSWPWIKAQKGYYWIWIPFAKLPIIKAASRAYPEIRHQYYPAFVEAAADSPARTLDGIAELIGITSIPVFGMHPVSKMFEEIDKLVLNPEVTEIRDGALYNHNGQHPRFTDVSIKRWHLKQAIAELNGKK